MVHRLLPLAAGALVLAACGSTRTVTVTVPAKTTPAPAAVSALVAEGAHDFNQFACSQCHGLNGQGGVSPDVPALKTVGKTTSGPAPPRSSITASDRSRTRNSRTCRSGAR